MYVKVKLKHSKNMPIDVTDKLAKFLLLLQ